MPYKDKDKQREAVRNSMRRSREDPEYRKKENARARERYAKKHKKRKRKQQTISRDIIRI